jgi:hypothetical protein
VKTDGAWKKGVEREMIVARLRALLSERRDILFAYLFGSASESIPFRDIDVAIWWNDGHIFRPGSDAELDLGIELENALALPVDLVVLNHASDALIHRASLGILLVDRDPGRRAELLETSWARYFDFQPKRDAFIAELATAPDP